MDLAKYYFKNGCTNCNGGEVFYLENAFLYKCRKCKAFAHAHREKTLHAKKHEPFQYLADQNINNLRKTLEDLFNRLWRDKITYNVGTKKRRESLINIVYQYNIRKLNNDFVRIINIDPATKKCSVISFEERQVIDDINYLKLDSATNREKSYLWLSEQLNVNYDMCKIGYLSELQLKIAIELCIKHIDYAREKTLKFNSGGT